MKKLIKLNNVQLGLINLVEPYEFNSGQLKYSTQIVVDLKDRENIDKVKSVLQKLVSIKGHETKEEGMVPVLRRNFKHKDAAQIIIKGYNKEQPCLFDKNHSRAEAYYFHRGDFVDAVLEFSTYNREGKNGISCKLLEIYKDMGVAV